MNDQIEELLTAEGRRWRDTLGPDPDLSAMLSARRPRARALTPILIAAAAAVVAVVCVAAVLIVSHTTGSPGKARRSAGGDAAASCVAPVLSTKRSAAGSSPGYRPSLGRVSRGERVTVYGRWYFGGPCRDTSISGQEPRTATPSERVRLALTTSDKRTRVLTTVHPDHNASFTARLTIPADAAPGSATISDTRGGVVDLVIRSGRSAPPTAPAPAAQQVTYRHLAVRVPASWIIDNAKCGIPQGNTVLLPMSTLSCVVPAKPGATWVEFEPSGVRSDVIRQATIRHVTVDGHSATEVSGRLDGDAVVRVDVPDAQAEAAIQSPDPNLARQIAATLSVVNQDSHGCSSEAAYRPLSTAARPAVPGADRSLVPGEPTWMSVCRYDGSQLTGGVAVPATALAGDVGLLRHLPSGLSVAAERFNIAASCTAPDDPAASLDREDAEWYAVLVGYRTGPLLTLRARLGFCGYLGISNGSASGQETRALVRFLSDTTRISGSAPESVRPVR